MAETVPPQAPAVEPIASYFLFDSRLCQTLNVSLIFRPLTRRLPPLDFNHQNIAADPGTIIPFPSCGPKSSTLHRCRSFQSVQNLARHRESTRTEPVTALSPCLLQETSCSRPPSSISAILTKDYSVQVNNSLKHTNFIPYFSSWTISGFKYDKVRRRLLNIIL